MRAGWPPGVPEIDLMSSNSNPTPSRGGFLGAALLLTAVLLLLFHGSLEPGNVLFANDAPLGRLVAQADIVWSNFKAYWVSMDWIGINLPSGAPSFTPISYAVLGPVLFAKFHVPLSLMLLGLAAWFFCRRMGFGRPTAALTALAAALNSNVVSYGCWGLPGKAAALAFVLLAVGLLSGEAAGWRRLAQVAVAGFCVGLTVIEGADVGAILSLYVAAFVVWQTVITAGKGTAGWLKGGIRLALVAVFAGWLAAHALSTLIGTQIVGVAGMAQREETREQRWDFATFGSFPKLETLRFAVPGLFGYRMDSTGGGAYWGGVGSRDGTPAGRFSGSGEYVGLLVLLVASLAVAGSLRRERSPFSPAERRWIWFWAVVAAGSLLLAYGRFAPFYQLFFALPYFSTIRFPGKFLHGMNLALWVLFAYGLEALARGALATGKGKLTSWKGQFEAWKTAAPAGERRWVFGAVGVFAASVFAAVAYASSATSLTAYFGTIEFQPGAGATAAFSIREVWLAVLIYAGSLAVIVGILIGRFGGRANLAWWLLGGILVADLYRANVPWVKHYDYVARYQSNAVLDLLREQPWEHRVTAFLDPRRAGPLVGGEAAGSWVFLQKEWLEHHFQYFKIQSLDIDQMPRTPELEEAYFGALSLMANQKDLPLVARLWQLTNTRYILGAKDAVDQFNQMLDPLQRRLQVRLPFTLGLKPGAPPPSPTMPIADVVQSLTATPSEQGQFAVIEFTGALPRAKLYTDWRSGLSDSNTLETLRSPDFDPAKQVLLAKPVDGIAPAASAPPGEASIVSHAPKQVVIKTKSTAAGVLLLNDRWHPDWKVTVDGQPAELLRANFIMRGVAVPAGEHTVEFRFEPPHGTLWISLSAIVVGLILVGVLIVVPEPRSAD